MRPEPFGRTAGLSGTKYASFAVLLLAPVFIASLAVSPLAAASPLGPPVYDPASFAKELQTLKMKLDAADWSTVSLREYREALPKSWSVEASGRHYEVPAGPLVSHVSRAERQLGERQHELEEARAYLDSLGAEASSFSGAQSARTDVPRAKLDAILARPEYAHAKGQNWYDRARDRINELLLNLLERTLSRVGGEKTLGYALLWLGIAAAAVLIAYWVFRNWFRSARAAEIALAGAAQPALSWQQWVFAAREAGARTDYRMAVHCAYWAGIARLQEVGVLSRDRAKTPREYLRALTSGRPIVSEDAAARRQALTQMTARLERTWYGYQHATETDFRDSLAQLELLGCHLP